MVHKFLFVLVSWLIQIMLRLFLEVMTLCQRNPPPQVAKRLIFGLKTKGETDKQY